MAVVPLLVHVGGVSYRLEDSFSIFDLLESFRDLPPCLLVSLMPQLPRKGNATSTSSISQPQLVHKILFFDRSRNVTRAAFKDGFFVWDFAPKVVLWIF